MIWQRETIDLQVPGGYKFMVKPIIYIDSEIPVVYKEYNMQVYGKSEKLLPQYSVLSSQRN